MSAHAARRDGLTIAEFLELPEEDAWRIELVRGRLVREPRPATLHGRVLATLTRLLDAHVVATSAGTVLTDTGFITERDPDTVLGPDLAFVSAARLPADPYAEAFLSGAPDLAIEIVSPSNRLSALRRKAGAYLRAGARLVWIVQPRARSVTVHRADVTTAVYTDDMTLDAAAVLPELRIPLSELFRL